MLACGVALFVMATGMYDSLERARDNYYDSARMADVAVSVVRAPDPVANDLAELPGVNALEARVTGIGLLDLAGKSDPVSARLVSLPPDRHPRVNDVLLRAGRWPDPTRDNEVLINEAFAEANYLAPGAQLRALIYGRYRQLDVVGIASSPEFVFAVAPGAMLPEPERFGVVWMGREALGRAFDVDGAFNDVVFRLAPGADVRDTIFAIDTRLARHGGRGAYGRDRMLSAQFLADELTSLRTMASILPPIFLLVAVFLLNVSLSRLVATERSNIGLLKSFGYGNVSIALHYAQVRDRVRAARRGDRRDRRSLPRRLHGADLQQGVSHSGAGVRCEAARLSVGRRRFVDRGVARRRAGSAACGAIAAGRGAGAACAGGLRPAGAGHRECGPQSRRQDAHGRAPHRALPAPLGDDGRRHHARALAAHHVAAFPDLDESHRRRDVRRRAADGRDADVRGNRGRPDPGGSRAIAGRVFGRAAARDRGDPHRRQPSSVATR